MTPRVENVSDEPGDEKRNAYRITEEALLAVKPVPAGHDIGRPAELLFDLGVAADVKSRLADLDKGFRECHARLARHDALAAEAVDWLAAQIGVLKDVLFATTLETDNHLEREVVSLGANGIGFHLSQPQPNRGLVAFHLVLLPQRETLLGYGRVRQCRAVGDRFAIGVEFVELADDYQRRLNRHMLKSQISHKTLAASD